MMRRIRNRGRSATASIVVRDITKTSTGLLPVIESLPLLIFSVRREIAQSFAVVFGWRGMDSEKAPFSKYFFD